MNKILGWLFRKYARELKNELQSNADKSLHLQMEAFKATLDIKDLIRARFNGVRPQHPDEGSLLATHMNSLGEADLIAFLSKANEIMNNPTFRIVTNSLILESIEHAALSSPDMTDVNFNRASVNGVTLVEDTLQALDKQFHEIEELNKKMSDEERLSAL